MPPSTTILWFRSDLRLEDNLALGAALATRKPILPVFIWDTEGQDIKSTGPHYCWWLKESLSILSNSLNRYGSKLIIRQGSPLSTLSNIATEYDARHLFFNRRYEPSEIRIQRDITDKFNQAGIDVKSFNSTLLFEPHEILKPNGEPYERFSSFWNQALSKINETCHSSVKNPSSWTNPENWPDSFPLSLLHPKINVTTSEYLGKMWAPGEISATRSLQSFLQGKLQRYEVDRDRSDLCGTSQLSPHLHFGEISPRQIINGVMSKSPIENGQFNMLNHKLCTELGWREFAYHILGNFPQTNKSGFNRKFDYVPWSDNIHSLTAWQTGQTGFPIIDAGMRNLASTGWINNRMRMILSSFLVKNLLIPWQKGASWFEKTLIDADLASNTMGWQWISGFGTDSVPYFRIFNPVIQSKKTDPYGIYIKRWVPEVSKLSYTNIHEPSMVEDGILRKAKIRIGVDYPLPIIDYKVSRRRSLDAYKHSTELYASNNVGS